MSTLEARLSAPWDAAWIAERWPYVFELVDAETGVVAVHNFQELIGLAARSGSVGISWQDGALTLCVFEDCAKLVEV